MPLIWVDVETTGLDPERDKLLEVGILITDDNLVPLAPGLSNVLYFDREFRRDIAVVPVVVDMHEKSGLWAACLEKQARPLDQIEDSLLSILNDFVKPKEAPMAGSTISFDRAFLKKYMPRLEAFFHYRNVDVSTVKELCRRWAPEVYCQLPMVRGLHRVNPDIEDSLNELRFYREKFLRPKTLS